MIKEFLESYVSRGDPVFKLFMKTVECGEPICLDFTECLSEKGENIILDYYSGFLIRDQDGKLKIIAAYVDKVKSQEGDLYVVRLSIDIAKRLPEKYLLALLAHEIYGHICTSSDEATAQASTNNLLKALNLPSLDELKNYIVSLARRVKPRFTDFTIKEEDLVEFEEV